MADLQARLAKFKDKNDENLGTDAEDSDWDDWDDADLTAPSPDPAPSTAATKPDLSRFRDSPSPNNNDDDDDDDWGDMDSPPKQLQLPAAPSTAATKPDLSRFRDSPSPTDNNDDDDDKDWGDMDDDDNNDHNDDTNTLDKPAAAQPSTRPSAASAPKRKSQMNTITLDSPEFHAMMKNIQSPSPKPKTAGRRAGASPSQFHSLRLDNKVSAKQFGSLSRYKHKRSASDTLQLSGKLSVQLSSPDDGLDDLECTRICSLFQDNLDGSGGPEGLAALRSLILTHKGIPSATSSSDSSSTSNSTDTSTSTSTDSDSPCSLRGKVWKALLRVGRLDASRYIDLLTKGPSRLGDKLRNDTFRTFKTDALFKSRVPEEQLIRVLDAFVHSCPSDGKLGYVQGMNVLLAPFLYVMPELDAFTAYERFIKLHLPRYVYPSLDGAHDGAELVDEVLAVADPELYNHLRSYELSGQIYAFSSVLAVFGGSPPLNELLRLWDFLLAFGVHLNIICIVSQVLLMKEDLMASDNPGDILGRSDSGFPDLDAAVLIDMTVQIAGQLPDRLFARLVDHPLA